MRLHQRIALICSSSVRVGVRCLATQARSSLLAAYDKSVASGELSFNEKQYAVLTRLSRLSNLLHEQQPLLVQVQTQTEQPQQPRQLKGMYIFGQVGTGKTMLMDLFFEHCKISSSKKKRVHFHRFMLQVHEWIREHKEAEREKRRLEDEEKKKNAPTPTPSTTTSPSSPTSAAAPSSTLPASGNDNGAAAHSLAPTNTIPSSSTSVSERDAISAVAHRISKEARLLCFDEFQVTDVADAMIITKLFARLWQEGVVFVATSNRPPQDLYKEGINRHYFLPFLKQLAVQCRVEDINISDVDYRMLTVALDGAYYVDSPSSAKARIWSAFADAKRFGTVPVVSQSSLSSRGVVVSVPKAKDISVMMGRSLHVPHTMIVLEKEKENLEEKQQQQNAFEYTSCLISFVDLCESEKGAADYSALCQHFDCIYLSDVPRLSIKEHNKARRFITLVDTIYDQTKILIWQGSAPPLRLFVAIRSKSLEDQGGEGGEEVLENDGNNASATDNREIQHREEWRRGTDLSCIKGSRMYAIDSSDGSHLEAGAAPSPPSLVDAAQEELKLLEGELTSVRELAFAFKRAASRLTEMSGLAYAERWKTRMLERNKT